MTRTIELYPHSYNTLKSLYTKDFLARGRNARSGLLLPLYHLLPIPLFSLLSITSLVARAFTNLDHLPYFIFYLYQVARVVPISNQLDRLSISYSNWQSSKPTNFNVEDARPDVSPNHYRHYFGRRRHSGVVVTKYSKEHRYLILYSQRYIHPTTVP
ncbi:hypothetical protein BDZ97DRAFT_1798529 [Flammula alnicola]|nr:hypothetical protein BDZ97DRAFT_1798529 [Flammula alnicola]